ncbi:MAG: glycosyl hydrolase, partial [Longimicrobiales bacterium]
CYGGQMSFLDRSTGQQRSVNVWPVNPMGNSAEDLRERFQWNHPIEVSQVDPDVVYVGSQHVWRSDNRGQSWQRISPDLTYADPETLGASGGPITRDQTSVEYYATVWRIAASPHSADEIWTGSDDGRVHVTRDGGQTWNDITPPDLPRFSRIHEIDVSPHQPGKAYVAAVRYRMQDIAPYAYRTEDYGATWTKIVDGIPHGHFVRTVREDRVRPGLLYAGTEHGVKVSFDDGASWQSLDLDLPDVSVQGLVLKDNDIVIATHGRSYYVLDNIASLRQLSAEVLASRTQLFQPATAVRTLSRPAEGYSRERQFRPEVDYWLAEDAEDVRIEILDATGQVVRTFAAEEEEEQVAEEEAEQQAEAEERDPAAAEEEDEEEEEEERPERGGGDRGPPAEAGLNRFVWDMRYEGARDFEGMIMWGGNVQGPIAPPGQYQVRLTALGETKTESFEIVKDPRLTQVTQADFDAQFRLAREIVQRVDDAHAAVLTIRNVREQVDDRLSKSEAPELAELGGAFRTDIGDVEGEIYQVRLEARQDPLNFPIKVNNQIAALRGIVESADGRPTDQSREAFSFLSQQLEGELEQLRVLLTNDLGELNELLEGLGLDRIVVPDPEAEIVSN